MTLKDVQGLPVLQTAAVSSAAKDPETHDYVIDCLLDLFGGYYGEVPEEDTESNNAELAAGEGRIVAHYPAQHGLSDDLFIIAVFSAELPGMDSNHIMVMYANEY